MKNPVYTIAFSLLAITSQAWAVVSDEVLELQSSWAEAMYQSTGNTKKKRLESLAEHARKIAQSNPNDANVLIWEGIVLASYAGEKGGLGALSLAKEAKAALEQAIAIEPKAMNGSAYTSLGSLYYQVPGWPIGFGNDTTAESYLKKGIETNPTGIDPHYFYGDYLFRQGRLDEARAELNKALEAPPRPNRAIADEGRKGEIRALLEKIKAKKSG